MKRKVILYISQSLDGFIADDQGSVDWIGGNDHEYVSDYGYESFIKDVDTVILGANTYKQIICELSKDKWVYEDLQSYVLTSEKIKDTVNIKYVNMDIKELIHQLQQEKGKNIWICGGAHVISQCIKEHVIDEYHITTLPVILGKGIRLFGESHGKIKLKLKEVKEENGLILGVYVNQ